MSKITLKDLTTGGKVLPITRWGEPVMHQATEPVTEFGPELHELIRNMFATMAVAKGVGLAATQVGVGISLFIYDCPDENNRNQMGIVCNPTVTLPEGKQRRLDATEEGCLSYPGAFQTLARPDTCVCTGVDQNGDPVTIEGTGLLARCLQHETDHLSGMVFGDRLSARSRKKLREQHDSLAEMYVENWPVVPKQPRN